MVTQIENLRTCLRNVDTTEQRLSDAKYNKQLADECLRDFICEAGFKQLIRVDKNAVRRFLRTNSD